MDVGCKWEGEGKENTHTDTTDEAFKTSQENFKKKIHTKINACTLINMQFFKKITRMKVTASLAGFNNLEI